MAYPPFKFQDEPGVTHAEEPWIAAISDTLPVSTVKCKIYWLHCFRIPNQLCDIGIFRAKSGMIRRETTEAGQSTQETLVRPQNPLLM
ncbi:MAG: hypothetical protein CXZ00_09600 [Acidobacteria bacterium]|nr:MAG: hypothetical protein CXZ00_09600 [Acidobacteriota bacterium]